MDWHSPDAQAAKYPNYNDKDPAKANPNFPRYVEQQLKPQVKELLTNYGPVGVMWFDGEWIPEWTEEQGKDLYAFCRSIQPNVIVNNRVGKGRRSMQGMTKEGAFAGDFGTPEQEVPPTGFPPGVDWESCMTMNKTWGFKKDDREWKSEQQLIRTLVDVASKGGNFLLNVGPTAAGEIPPESVERLAAIGRWMDTNGDSIYGTSASPFEKLPFGRATRKGATLYLHVFEWPADGKLTVPMRGKVRRASLLADPARAVNADPGKQGLQLTVTGAAPDANASVIALELDGEIDPVPPAPASR
jgi:alpha-L-fucosidase